MTVTPPSLEGPDATTSRIIRGVRRALREARERVKKVLFVCTANVCRSSMAAAMFKALAEDRDRDVKMIVVVQPLLSPWATMVLSGMVT